METMEKQLEFTLELGRTSVIYAEEMFTVYINVKNVSNEKLYLWDLNIYPSAEFKFKRRGASLEKITITEKLKKFISNFSQKTKTVQKEETPPELTEKQVQEMAKEDMIKVYYYNQIRKKELISRVLCPGESFTEYFLGRTKKSLFFRPDKYRFVLWADYSNQKDEFMRESQSKEVDVLVSINSIIYGAILGGFMGVFVKIFSTPDIRFISILSIETLFQLILALIFSVLAVVAFARKSSAQTLITIPDFWGGIFVGFLAGYSGKTFIEKYILPTA